MRPKIVLLILAVAFVALGFTVALKGLMGKKNETSTSPGQPTAVQNQATATDGTNQTTASSSVNVTVSDQMRATIIDKETEQIHACLVEYDATNSQAIIERLLGKLSNHEPEVRDAALDVLKQLNDTNAVPGLKKYADSLNDPRQKVAVLDIIDYLNTPSITQNVAVDSSMTNSEIGVHTNQYQHVAEEDNSPNSIRGHSNGTKHKQEGPTQ